MRIPVYLSDQRVAFEWLPHPPAYTAHRLAQYLGLPGRQVVKGVLLHVASGACLAVLPATHHVDTAALGRLLGESVRLATEVEIAEVFPDCEWGVVSPFGRLYGLSTVLEDSLAGDAMIVFEAHSHVEAIRMRCRDYEQLERPRRLRFAREAEA